MFEISELKEKTLVELQAIAKEKGLKKISQLKKLDLVYQILDLQAVSPIEKTKSISTTKSIASKSKRKRVAYVDESKTSKNLEQKADSIKPSSISSQEVSALQNPDKNSFKTTENLDFAKNQKNSNGQQGNKDFKSKSHQGQHKNILSLYDHAYHLLSDNFLLLCRS